MYELKIISHLSAAHQLKEINGPCEKLHGHNWKIEAYVSGPQLDANGLLLDFRIVKNILEKAVARLDHRFLNELEPFQGMNPSSENIARWLFEQIGQEISSDRVRVNKVSAWESDTACATYSGPNA